MCSLTTLHVILRACECVPTCILTCMYVPMFACKCTQSKACVLHEIAHVSLCNKHMHASRCLLTYACERPRMCACVYVYICVCMCVCVSVCV